MKISLLIFICFLYGITNLIAGPDTLKISKKEYEYFYQGKHKLTLSKAKRKHMDELLSTILSDDSALKPIYLIILYSNGSKYKEGLWSALTYTNPYKEYYKNGKIKIIGQYREDGKPRGKWIYYKITGEVEREQQYPPSRH